MSRYKRSKEKLSKALSSDRLTYPIIAGIISGLVVAFLTAPVTSSYARYFVAGTLVHGDLPEIDIDSTDPYLEPRWTEESRPSYQPELKIESASLEDGREIFRPSEKVNISFQITNTKNIPYNITVDWIHQDQRYSGWSIRSTEEYNINESFNYYYSHYDPRKKGDWRVHILVEYIENGDKHTETLVKKFEVI